jgi:hypothetical protein
MKNTIVSYVRRALSDQRGQVLPWVALAMLAFMGMAGLTVDVGHAYVSQSKLQYCSNAAALAGAAAMPSSSAPGIATSYGCGPGGENADPSLGGPITITATTECLATLTNQGIPCPNAIKVTQKIPMPTIFMAVLGIKTVPISTTATAAMAGGTNQPYNIAVVVDTTASMNDNDSKCGATQITCALEAVQTMLLDLAPCQTGITCVPVSGHPGQVVNPVDNVALFAFPAVTTATKSKDYTCPTSNPSIVPYTFTNVTPGSSQNLLLPTTATYEIVPFSADYRTSDASTTLNTSSDLVVAAGGLAGCHGMQAPGGEGTYYAQAIYAAQAALEAQQAANPGTLNAMFIVSDGDATAASSSGQIKATTGTLNGTGSNTSVTYPSALGECGQAVSAAASAASSPNANGQPGTIIYTFGYGAETSGCTTDAKYSATVTAGGGSWKPGDSPCNAIQAMASALDNFFSDDGAGCVSPDNSQFSSLKTEFAAAVAHLTNPRLIPNSTT